jgi:TRAP-type C4-dicarboxylate transport system permease small subunit
MEEEMKTKSGYENMKKAFNSGCRAVNALGGGALVLIMLLITADVITRSVFDQSINGVFEIVELLMAVTVSMGLAYAGVQGAHVAVDFLVAKFSPKTQRLFDIVNHLISAGLFALICWKSLEQAVFMRESETTTVLLELKLFPYLIVLGICAGLLSLVYLFRLVDTLKGGAA